MSTYGDVGPIGPIQNEAQARPLAIVPREDRPAVWREAVETAPDGKVTARHVRSVVDRRLPSVGHDSDEVRSAVASLLRAAKQADALRSGAIRRSLASLDVPTLRSQLDAVSAVCERLRSALEGE